MTFFYDLRVRTGLTVPQLADKLGYDRRSVYRWERGESQPRKAVVDHLRNMIRDQAQPNENEAV